MTVSSAVRKAGPFTGNGSTTVYPFSFKIYTKNDIEIIRADLNGLESTLAVDSDYSVTLNADQDNSPGGYITLLLAALPSNYKLTILGNLLEQQLTDLTNLGGFFPQTVEDMVDRSTILIQQLEEKVERSVQIPATSSLDPADLVDTIVAASTAVNTFFGVYYGAYPSNPSVDPLGNPPNSGDMYYNTTAHQLLVYDASLATWTTQPSGASLTSNIFSGTGAQVNFTLSSSPSTINNLMVFVGGVAQRPTTDFTVAGTTLTFVSAPPNAANNVLAFVLNNVIVGAIDGANIFNTIDTAKLKYNRTSAEIIAGVTPTNYAYPQGDVRRYGAVLDGVTNDYAAINSAIAVSGQIFIPGTAAVASASLGSTGFAVPANTQIFGLGRSASSITITGTNSCNLFTVTDVNNFRLADISILGNSQASGSGIGFAVFGKLTAGVAADKKRFVVEDCHFQNFKGDYWIYFENNSATYSFESIYVERNTFESFNGNTRDPTLIGIPSACFGIFGGPTNSATGNAKGVYVRKNNAICTYMKQFADVWNNCIGVWITDNIIRNCGSDAQFPNDAGCYAITVYQQSTGGSVPSTQVHVSGNTIISPKSCGVYSVRTTDIEISGNTISGQTDTVNTSLPKGAVAINGGAAVLVTGNILTDNYIGISFVAEGATATRHTAIGNKIKSTVTNNLGIYLSTSDNVNAGILEAIDNEIVVSGGTPRGVFVDISSSFSVEQVNIAGNLINSSYDGIILSAGGTASGINRTVIENNKISGCSNYGLAWQNYTNSLVLQGNKFLGGWGSASYLVDLASSTNVSVVGNVFCNMTSGTGFAFNTPSTQGSMVANTFINFGAAFRVRSTGSVDMGRDTPTWTGTQGDFVQDLVPTDTTDPGGANAIILGWTYTTAWRTNYSRY